MPFNALPCPAGHDNNKKRAETNPARFAFESYAT